MRAGFPASGAEITPQPSLRCFPRANRPSGRRASRFPRRCPQRPGFFAQSPLPFCSGIAVQSGKITAPQTSGNQPLPLSKRSASVAISPFFRWSSNCAVPSPFASRTASRIRALGTRFSSCPLSAPSLPRPCRDRRLGPRSPTAPCGGSTRWPRCPRRKG